MPISLSTAAPVLLTLASVSLPFITRALIRQARLSKVLPVIRRAFTVLDPLLNEHIKSYGSSDVRFVTELVTALLADGALTPEEVRYAAVEIQSRYRPELAAGKSALSLAPGSIEQKIYNAVDEVVEKGLFQGADAFAAARSLFTVIR